MDKSTYGLGNGQGQKESWLLVGKSTYSLGNGHCPLQFTVKGPQS